MELVIQVQVLTKRVCVHFALMMPLEKDENPILLVPARSEIIRQTGPWLFTRLGDELFWIQNQNLKSLSQPIIVQS